MIHTAAFRAMIPYCRLVGGQYSEEIFCIHLRAQLEAMHFSRNVPLATLQYGVINLKTKT
jgi:hypothetical protein